MISENLEQSQQDLPVYISHVFNSKFFGELNALQKYKNRISIKKQQKENSIEEQKIIKEQTTKCSTITYITNTAISQYIIRNGNKIKGNWINQKLHGDVQIIYPNGSIFCGIYNLGVRVSGYFKFSNHYQYNGGFLNDQFHGIGQLKFPDGRTIKGYWERQQIKGNAIIQYPQNDIYYGTIKQMKKHGLGHIFFNNGTKYTGEFIEGQISGYGIYQINDNETIQGFWGEGYLIRPSINPHKFTKNQQENIGIFYDGSQQNIKRLICELNSEMSIGSTLSNAWIEDVIIKLKSIDYQWFENFYSLNCNRVNIKENNHKKTKTQKLKKNKSIFYISRAQIITDSIRKQKKKIQEISK